MWRSFGQPSGCGVSMYVVELQFECFDNTTVSAVDKAINGLMDALRYNGQVLGREFPIVMGDGEFFVRAVCPEKESLHLATIRILCACAWTVCLKLRF